MLSHPLSKSYSENQHCPQFAMTQVSGVTISSFGSIVIKLLTIKVVKYLEIMLQTPNKKSISMCAYTFYEVYATVPKFIYFIWSMHTLKLISCLGVCNVISECFKHIFIWCMHMLKLISCLGVCNVVSECLNTLIVSSFMTMLPKLEIVAPKLESLQIEGSVDFLSKIEIKDVMALLKVKLIVNNVIPGTNNNMEVVDDCPKLHILHLQLLKWTPIYRKSTLPSIFNDSRFRATISSFGSIVMKLLVIKVVKHSNYVANSYTRNQFRCMPILYMKYMQLSQSLQWLKFGGHSFQFWQHYHETSYNQSR